MNLLISTEDNASFCLAIGRTAIEKTVRVRKPYKQSELLLQKIGRLLGKEQLTGIIVVKGPGGFSAVRIGVATANALGYAFRIPVVGIKNIACEGFDEKQRVEQLWQQGIKLLRTKSKKVKIVLPFYDKEPHITQPC